MTSDADRPSSAQVSSGKSRLTARLKQVVAGSQTGIDDPHLRETEELALDLPDQDKAHTKRTCRGSLPSGGEPDHDVAQAYERIATPDIARPKDPSPDTIPVTAADDVAGHSDQTHNDAAALENSVPAADGSPTSERLQQTLRNAGAALDRSRRAGWDSAKRFTTDHIGPRAIKLAKTARVHAKPEVMRRDYLRILRNLHEWISDRHLERVFFIPARPRATLNELTVASPNKALGHRYQPVNRAVFHWAMQALPEDLRGYTFIDYGAGRGRALLLAAEYGFDQIVGVEFAAELHDDCLMNIAQYPRSRMRCRKVSCLHADAIDLIPPPGNMVLFFNDPFDTAMLDAIIQRITASYREHPRRIYLIFIRPLRQDALNEIMDKSGVFAPLPLPGKAQLKIRFFSPDAVALFQSIV